MFFMENLRERLSRRMRELMRDDLNLDTQTKVANRSGVSQSSVQRLLALEQAATVDILEQLAKAFGIRRPECFLLEGDEVALLNEWSALSPTEKSAVLGYIQVVGQNRNSQLSIDAGRPVPATLQAAQQASAGRPAPQDAPLKHAAKGSKKSPPGRRRKA
jgi:transcriptional regulator with XRE-family HTH domain